MIFFHDFFRFGTYLSDSYLYETSHFLLSWLLHCKVTRWTKNNQKEVFTCMINFLLLLLLPWHCQQVPFFGLIYGKKRGCSCPFMKPLPSHFLLAYSKGKSWCPSPVLCLSLRYRGHFTCNHYMTQLEPGSDPRANEKLLELLAMTFHDLGWLKRYTVFTGIGTLIKPSYFKCLSYFFHKLIPSLSNFVNKKVGNRQNYDHFYYINKWYNHCGLCF